jgi:hypothetical protein
MEKLRLVVVFKQSQAFLTCREEGLVPVLQRNMRKAALRTIQNVKAEVLRSEQT